MMRTLALLASVALAAGASRRRGLYWQCTDRATTSSEELTQVSSRMVVPPVPSVVDFNGGRASLNFYLGLSGGRTSLRTSLSYSKNSGWTLQSCGYNTKSADEFGSECGRVVHVSSGDEVKLSVQFGGKWILSAKDETTGKESLSYITEYSAGKGYTNAFVGMNRLNFDTTFHATEFRCDHLPASAGLQFDKIMVNGSPGSAWKALPGCGGACASNVTFNDDGSSMQWSWDANGSFIV